MKIKCEYCGSCISDTGEKCPNCGGTNFHLMRSAEKMPKTIEELWAFCNAHKLPLEKMRSEVQLRKRPAGASTVTWKKPRKDFFSFLWIVAL